MEFPRYVFRCANADRGPVDSKLANNQDEFDKLISDEWHFNIAEAVAASSRKKTPVVVTTHDNEQPEASPSSEEFLDELPPTREELETKANELNIKFDGRTTDKKLEKLISKAIE